MVNKSAFERDRRVELLRLLKARPSSTAELCAAMPEVHRNTVLQHLMLLERWGAVRRERIPQDIARRRVVWRAIADEVPERPPRERVGDACRELILAGLPDGEVLRQVRAKFPRARTGPADLETYRVQLRKDGHAVSVRTGGRQAYHFLQHLPRDGEQD